MEFFRGFCSNIFCVGGRVSILLKTNRLTFFLLAAIVMLGAFLRLHNLGRPALWIDEVTVVTYAEAKPTAWALIDEIYHSGLSSGVSGQHMPFQYACMNLCLRLYHALGIRVDEFWLRLPFALIGIAAIPLVFLAGLWAYNRRTGLWLSFLFAISFFHAYQSRDATSYAPLIFFLSLNFAGLGLVFRHGGNSKKMLALGLAMFAAGTFGAQFSHLTSWFAMVTEGLCIGVAMLWRFWKHRAPLNLRVRHVGLELAVLIVLAVASLPMFPLLLDAAHTSAPHEGDIVDHVTLPLLAYQCSIFGWGRGQGRLAIFAVAWVAGLAGAWRARGHRNAAILNFALIVIPAAIFFRALHRDFFPRYLSATFLPFLAFSACGLDQFGCWCEKRFAARKGYAMLAVPAFVVLILFGAQPFSALFSMRDKLMPMSQIRSWVEDHCPPGGLYVWRNGYHLREVPGDKPIAGRSPAFGDYPNAGIPDEVYAWRSKNTRSFFSRFPNAVYIVDPPVDERFWKWSMTDFAVNELVANKELGLLWNWGLSPHGYRITNDDGFVCCLNREEDVAKKLAQNGKPFAWPSGPKWQYVQAQDGQLFTLPTGEGAQLSVYLPKQKDEDYYLDVRGMAVDGGSLYAWVVKNGQAVTPCRLDFQKTSSWSGRLGPFRLGDGPSSIALTRQPAGQMNLLIHDFDLHAREGGG